MLRKIMKKLPVLAAVLVLLSLPIPAEAQELAQNISGRKLVQKSAGISSVNMLFDGYTKEPVRFRDGTQLTLSHEEGIGSLYLIFDKEYGSYTVTDQQTGEIRTWGESNFLHEFLDLEEAFGKVPTTVTISFEQGDGILNELYAFTSGQTPDFVQKWEQPKDGQTDIVLFSTHGDDEQLFFAGMLPYYAAERGCQVQVVYMTGHRNMSMRRSHEMLDGLWAVGVRTYPVFGSFADFNTRSKQETYEKYHAKGIAEEDILSFVVEQIRRFKPKVAVGHDLAGEYGHGMHMVYAEQLCNAADISADASQFPESAETFGVWDVPKTYLHLYPENQIVMDWDQPLESFGGMTAYEVTKELGFPAHISQQTYYSWYFAGKKTAADITQYSPREFGMYRSTVGKDIQKNDFLENITTHAEDVQILEQQRLAEEARQQEEARIAAERAAAEAMQKESEIQPEMNLPAQDAGNSVKNAGVFWILPAFTIVIILIVVLIKTRKNR